MAVESLFITQDRVSKPITIVVTRDAETPHGIVICRSLRKDRGQHKTQQQTQHSTAQRKTQQRTTMIAARRAILAQKSCRWPVTSLSLTPSLQQSFLFSSSSSSSDANKGAASEAYDSDNDNDIWNKDRVSSYVGHTFPDFIEGWNASTFRKVGYGLSAVTAGLGVGGVATGTVTGCIPAAVIGALTAGYWRVGLKDMEQTSHAVRRSFPVLGNFRYIFETIRPEIRQYFVESDFDGVPFDRLHRVQVYQRAKNVSETLPFGTRRNVYKPRYEWANHSMFPAECDTETGTRTTIGAAEWGTTKPYSASVLNISAMSYGALSDNAVLALNRGARLGGFYHNTGEGGVSEFHRKGKADLVWNIGSGYFGCGSLDGTKRVFDPELFRETIEECKGRIKMVEIKLAQGAKSGVGGHLPKQKITKKIAEARKLPYPVEDDCHSPPMHSAFRNHHELMEFAASLRELGGGIPVGVKLCVGRPSEIAHLTKSMLEVGTGLDFITVDGGEGGTGAAPAELSNSVGMPLEEGLVLVRDLLTGAGLRDKVKLIASGKVSSGFSIVKTVALGADVTNAARGMCFITIGYVLS